MPSNKLRNMAKTLMIKLEIPDYVDAELLKSELNRIIGRVIMIKELKDVDVKEDVIDKISEEIKEAGWVRIKKWLE